jgi:hypothetical protein
MRLAEDCKVEILGSHDQDFQGINRKLVEFLDNKFPESVVSLVSYGPNGMVGVRGTAGNLRYSYLLRIGEGVKVLDVSLS